VHCDIYKIFLYYIIVEFTTSIILLYPLPLSKIGPPTTLLPQHFEPSLYLLQLVIFFFAVGRGGEMSLLSNCKPHTCKVILEFIIVLPVTCRDISMWHIFNKCLVIKTNIQSFGFRTAQCLLSERFSLATLCKMQYFLSLASWSW
jgi:hypothetical protein